MMLKQILPLVQLIQQQSQVETEPTKITKDHLEFFDGSYLAGNPQIWAEQQLEGLACVAHLGQHIQCAPTEKLHTTTITTTNPLRGQRPLDRH
eukprot:scaffold46055_cov56-Cyclotella_meneghiniana.AAC.6